MNEKLFLDILVIAWFGLALITFSTLFFITAPYGRHVRRGWGPSIKNKVGWVAMEAPAALVFAACFFLGRETHTAVALVLAMLWEVHYVYRAFIYPLSLRGREQRMPLAVVGMAVVFNSVNGYLNGRHLFTFSGGYPLSWLTDPRFVVGTILFAFGLLINRRADRTLRNLRQPGDSGYRIPEDGMYRWVSCPNYLGEIGEWFGWAIATWSLPGLAFAVWVAANLIPRARAHHAWYQEQFSDYPPGRKALLPHVW